MYSAAPFILYLLNAQGNVTGMTNSAGKLVIPYTYDAWGRWVYFIQDTEWSNILGGINSLMYRGYVYDHETSELIQLFT